jgi:hypothetical protein
MSGDRSAYGGGLDCSVRARPGARVEAPPIRIDGSWRWQVLEVLWTLVMAVRPSPVLLFAS